MNYVYNHRLNKLAKILPYHLVKNKKQARKSPEMLSLVWNICTMLCNLIANASKSLILLKFKDDRIKENFIIMKPDGPSVFIVKSIFPHDNTKVFF